ncbi:MarR family winged helix-turn-helix transcriptional regulator [Microbaculum marinum]|uniref:MarR family transcriptional regulator n=1 Tax=Microbaculum marinum TaxID=1764581 RepID=A0AAW9RU52_9HYPH
MTRANGIPLETTLEIRDTCLCLRAQRAARALARRFDEALRPLGLTNGQFSLLVSLNRPAPPTMGATAELLAMDRTTLTAALKPLQRRGLVRIEPAASDKRSRLMLLTDDGRQLLARAVPIWRREHAEVDRDLGGIDIGTLKTGLGRLSERSVEQAVAPAG